ncbi:kelch repeat-containing protein, partial [Salmonella sp. SAL4356]|uniref:kelch repeat-containing protein n=1 Tax=Salmonella sp. SAL4356 TaxID=3159877 RepID=UPI00397CE79D
TLMRAAHTATLLPNGQVLIAGGFSGDQNSLASAETFDPAQEKFVSAGNMSVSRSGHTATLLPNGKVLIAGGYNGDYLASAELYDP